MGVIDTGVVVGKSDTSGTQIVQNTGAETESSNNLTLSGATTHEALDMDSKGVGASVYLRFIKPLGKDVENIACQQLVEQGVKIAKGKGQNKLRLRVNS